MSVIDGRQSVDASAADSDKTVQIIPFEWSFCFFFLNLLLECSLAWLGFN
jgi:hypothetical protein